MGDVSCHDDVADIDALDEQVRLVSEGEPPVSRVVTPRRGASGAHPGVVAQLSHDLRTPLNAIIGFTELLQDGHLEPSSPDYHEALASIASNGRRLLVLIDELLVKAEEHVGAAERAQQTEERAR